MESPQQIVFTRQAFLKAMLHACQHPTTPVYGALLAEPIAAKDDTKQALRVVAVAPLFHETPLGPLLEVAMTMIMKTCAAKGLVPVGIYYGSDHYDEDRSYPHAESIANNFGGKGAVIRQPILAVIRSGELANPKGQPLELLEGHGSAYKTVTLSKLVVEDLQESNKALTAVLAGDGAIAETDFNDHIVTTAKWPVLEVQSAAE